MPSKKKSPTVNRKKEHVDIVLGYDVAHQAKTNGLERFDFVHNALPELSLSEIDTSIEFLRSHLSMPLMVTGMTGGFPGATKINGDLASVCEEKKIALGVGSQRQLMEDDSQLQSYRIARMKAPTIPIVGNIGAAQVAGGVNEKKIRTVLDVIQASALAIHLNALQESVQHEGDLDFRGILKGISELVHRLDIPIIVKETGAGISYDVAKRLMDVGVRYIDISGAGGTSWSAVESFRKTNGVPANHSTRLAKSFWNWGIPTALCLQEVSRLPDLFIIASGGIRDGKEIAKCFALGAHLTGMARPLLQVLARKGVKALADEIDYLKKELTLVMFLTGSRNILEMKKARLISESPGRNSKTK